MSTVDAKIIAHITNGDLNGANTPGGSGCSSEDVLTHYATQQWSNIVDSDYELFVSTKSTSNRFEKRRTYYDRLGEFIEYENGNVKIKLLTPVVIGSRNVFEVVVPSYHTQFLAKNKQSIPQEYVNSYIINVPG